jgi:hypothetical protein
VAAAKRGRKEPVRGAEELPEKPLGDYRLRTEATSLAVAREAAAAVKERVPPRWQVRGKLTPERLSDICARIAAGTAVKHACYLEAVTPVSLYEAMERHPEVADAVKLAQATAHDAMRLELYEMVRAGHKTAHVLLAYMERAAPDTYAPPKLRAELSGPDGAPLQVATMVAAPVTLAEALKRVESLRNALTAGDTVDGEVDDDPPPDGNP